MTKSYTKDVQLLTEILDNQNNIKNVLKRFNCNENNLEEDKHVYDLCAFYMVQIGESAKSLTDATKNSFKHFNYKYTSYFRNKVVHAYEKINRKLLKAYIFSTISKETVAEIKARITYCQNNSKTNTIH